MKIWIFYIIMLIMIVLSFWGKPEDEEQQEQIKIEQKWIKQ